MLHVPQLLCSCCSISFSEEFERGNGKHSDDNGSRNAFLCGTRRIESRGLHIHQEPRLACALLETAIPRNNVGKDTTTS